MKKSRCLIILLSLGFLGASLGGNLAVFWTPVGALSTEEDAEYSNPQETLEQGPEDFFESDKIGVVIESFNPGYTNEGEFFQLRRLKDESISLAGLSVIYTTSSEKEYVVFEFPEGSEMVGESLLMRLASSDEVKGAEDYHQVADEIYTRNMAQGKGMIELEYGGERFERLCWGFENEECFLGFDSKKPTTLVRNLEAEEMEERFSHVEGYVPEYNPEEPGLVIQETPESLEEKIEPRCRELSFSEILTYYESGIEEQFIEIFNRGEERIEVSGCFLKYKSKSYNLSGEVAEKGFLLIYPKVEWELSLTKNPTSVNTLEIIDTDGEKVDTLSYYSGQKKGVALANFGYTEDGQEIWRQTYLATPGRENEFQEFRSCPVGKVINLETGNCVNETTLVVTQAACPEGKYRNPLTGRCKSYETATSTEQKPCAEGYERNPETGRCRKIVKNEGAEFPVEIESLEGDERRVFVAKWAIVTVIIAGVGYIGFQYKEEIGRLLRK